MSRVPRGALVLAAAGLIPFIAGALTAWGILQSPLFLLGYTSPEAMLLAYGKIILAFMGGAIWGFGVTAGMAIIALSVIPALFAFLIVGDSLILLGLGFAALLILDFIATRDGLAPGWWMALRVPITIVAVFCLVGSGL